MTSTTIRIITIALAMVAVAAPAATAMPVRDNSGVRTSSLAGTSTPKQDLRNADQRATPPVPLKPDVAAPVARSQPRRAADDGGPSPLAYIVPSLVLAAMLAAGVAYARSPRQARA
jgi:hypothetical protein